VQESCQEAVRTHENADPKDDKQLVLGVPRLLLHRAKVTLGIELEFESERGYLARLDLLTHAERGALGRAL
jgi:hypothetical protein